MVVMTGDGVWRMLAVLGVLAAVSFLLVSPVEAQSDCLPACGSHASCYYNSYNRGYFCACDGYYTGNGYSCKYSTWRVVLYILSSVIGFILIFFLCLSCLGYFRRQQQQQPLGYPMQPMYPPPQAGPYTQAAANPAMYSYPPQAGSYPPPQTGYPVNAYPPQVVNHQQQQPNSKVPGPSGTV